MKTRNKKLMNIKLFLAPKRVGEEVEEDDREWIVERESRQSWKGG